MLSFHLYFDSNNKELDDIEKYNDDDHYIKDETKNAHLITYNNDNFYIITIFGDEAKTTAQNELRMSAPDSFIDIIKYYHEGDLVKPSQIEDDLFIDEEEEED